MPIYNASLVHVMSALYATYKYAKCHRNKKELYLNDALIIARDTTYLQ